MVSSVETTGDAVRTRAASLFGTDVIYVPVRHQSPACAWHVQSIIRAVKPSLVLIEGPEECTPEIVRIADPAARAPFAIYAYATFSPSTEPGDPVRFYAFYPLCDYSPELVGIREATACGARVAFIDLPYAEQCAIELAARPDRRPVAGEDRSLLDERWLRRNAYIGELARRLGCRDHDDVWDHLFETDYRARDSRRFVEGVYAYCSVARAEATELELERDGTTAREEHMARHIARALAERDPAAGPIVVVTGGFHTVVLPDLVTRTERVARPARHVPSDGGAALIRYSFDRLDRLNGYAAGMPSPAYYQRLWEASGSDERALRDIALETLIDVAEALRATDRFDPVSTPAVRAAFEMSCRLAELRGRRGPSREDIRDGIRSAFASGQAGADEPLSLLLAGRMMTGTRIGSVPEGGSTPPIVADARRQMIRSRLRIDRTETRSLSLEIYRRHAHRQTSRFLHALAYLNVPFAIRIAGPDFAHGTGLERVREEWRYTYSPLTEAALIEAARYGQTVADAARGRFDEVLSGLEVDGGCRNADTAVAALISACELGLHDTLARILPRLRDALVADTDIVRLATAATQLRLLWVAREPLEADRIDDLPGLVVRAFQQGCMRMPDLHTIAEADVDGIVAALLQLRDVANIESIAGADASLYWDTLADLHAAGRQPVIAGAAVGLRYVHRDLDDSDLERFTAGHLAGLPDPEAAFGFLRGLLQTSREVMWQSPGVLGAVDRELATWTDEAFLHALPQMRLAFSSLTPRETERVAVQVAALHGASSVGSLASEALDDATIVEIARADRAVASALERDGLDGWLIAN